MWTGVLCPKCADHLAKLAMARGGTEQASGWARGWAGSTLLPARQEPIAGRTPAARGPRFYIRESYPHLEFRTGVQLDIAARVNAHRLQKEAADALGLASQSLSLRKRKERLFAGKNPGLGERDQADKAQELVGLGTADISGTACLCCSVLTAMHLCRQRTRSSASLRTRLQPTIDS